MQLLLAVTYVMKVQLKSALTVDDTYIGGTHYRAIRHKSDVLCALLSLCTSMLVCTMKCGFATCLPM